jgi:SEC-C motif-containing protein/glycosyl transferase family 2
VTFAPGIMYGFRRPRIVAILPAYNEEDVIGSVIQHYLDDGVEVYLIDNCSTDGTAEIARQWLGNGVIRIERFPDDVGGSERARKEYMWGEILRRNEALAAELGADWYIRADADEFREGPWPGMSHAEAIALVDALGYSAVQSEVLEFRPTDDSFPSGGDPREFIHHYEPAEFANTLWIKAWKQPPAGVPVQIARTGGHAAEFEGRRLCPVHFISLHYPIRTPEHAKRKIFKERLERYPEEEREMGWHNHWDDLAASATDFLWDPADLIRYDLTDVRNRVLAQGAIDMILAIRLHGLDLTAAPDFNGRFAAWFGHACNADGPLTVEGMEAAHETMRMMAAAAYRGTPAVAPDPVLTHASLTLLEASIAHARGRGSFHNATYLRESRDTLLPLAVRQHEQATPPAAAAAAPTPALPDVPRNAPCPCGSGLKFKRCHGMRAAA